MAQSANIGDSPQPPTSEREVSGTDLSAAFYLKYSTWKAAAKDHWSQLERYCTNDTLRSLLAINELCRLEIIETYEALRIVATTSLEVRRRVDACEAASNSLVEHIQQRLDGKEVDASEVRRIHQQLRMECGSIFTSSTRRSERSASSLGSSCLRLEAAAELAAKEVRWKALEAKEKKEAEIEERRRELARLEVKQELEEARAKLLVYGDRDERDFECASGPTVIPITVLPPPGFEVTPVGPSFGFDGASTKGPVLEDTTRHDLSAVPPPPGLPLDAPPAPWV